MIGLTVESLQLMSNGANSPMTINVKLLYISTHKDYLLISQIENFLGRFFCSILQPAHGEKMIKMRNLVLKMPLEMESSGY